TGRIVDFGRPFGHGAEHGPVIQFLKRLAPADMARDLPNEHDHRRGILVRDVDAGGGVGSARATGDEADARPAGGLAGRFRHHGGAALLAAYGEREITIMECIENREIALAGHAESVAYAVDN